MGMVRQWQELLHDKNYSESYTAALPDFVKLAEAYGCVGIRATTPDELDEKINQMLNTNRPVIFDCLVDKQENCFPMIPSGKPHNQMILGPEDEKENKVAEDTTEYESSNLDELFKTLDEEDYNDEIAINFNAKSNLNVTERDYIKILDENKKEVYKEE